MTGGQADVYLDIRDEEHWRAVLGGACDDDWLTMPDDAHSAPNVGPPVSHTLDAHNDGDTSSWPVDCLAGLTR